MINLQQPPLMGFHWNEAEGDDLLNRGLITIIANDLRGYPHVIGTGFIVSAGDSKALCVTAAHVFSEVRRLQSPPQRHSLSALPEFLPPPNTIELDKKSLHVVSFDGKRVEGAAIEWLVFDETTDIAIFYIALHDPASGPFFLHEFSLDGTPPDVGDLVTVLSLGHQGISNYEHDGDQSLSFMIKLRPILRVGRVLAHYPGGHRLCRGPCIETSIPVYSGMSGGPVIHYGTEGLIKPFGLVCSDPDLDNENKQNKNFEGHSIFALLPCQVRLDKDGKQIATLTTVCKNAAGNFGPQQPKS